MHYYSFSDSGKMLWKNQRPYIDTYGKQRMTKLPLKIDILNNTLQLSFSKGHYVYTLVDKFHAKSSCQ